MNQSERIMILHLTDIKSDGAVFLDPAMSIQENAGTGRNLLRRNSAVIELKYPGECAIFACSPNGKRLFEVPFKRNGTSLGFTMNNASKDGCIVLYELIKK